MKYNLNVSLSLFGITSSGLSLATAQNFIQYFWYMWQDALDNDGTFKQIFIGIKHNSCNTDTLF